MTSGAHSSLTDAMTHAMALAAYAADAGDVPVGAVVLDSSGAIVGQGWNRREADADPTAHAEIIALREAGRQKGQWRLDDCTLVVTLEPCTMCAGALVLARVKHLAFGAWDPKAGAAGSMRDIVRDSRLNHRVEVTAGVAESQCAEQLRDFFELHR